MELHEYEGKKLFEKYGILVPRGVLVLNGEDVSKAYRSLDRWEVVCKAQVLARGRMEKGLVRFCSSEDEVLAACEEIFARDIWGEGAVAVLIEEKLEIEEERYLSIAYDATLNQPVLSYGVRGGEVERHILDIHADADIPSAGFPHIPFAQAAWNLYRREKALLVEISPLARISGGAWVAVDAKISLRESKN